MIHYRKKSLLAGFSLSLISLLFSFIVLETGLRFLISPSPNSYGTFLGNELPPIKIISSSPGEVNRANPYNDLIVNGQHITIGDLEGVYRDDLIMGYAPLENWTSENQWWTNNNLGAREEQNILQGSLQDQTRILIFGDSFTAGSAVSQQQVWPSFLQEQVQNTEILNFGVPGYGIGQSVLRFQQTRNELEYDIVILTFVPATNLWRDINTIRNLGEEGWHLDKVLPRFVMEQDQLRLINSPYENGVEIFVDNAQGISDKLHEHLITYDRFYFPAKHKDYGILDRSVIYKLMVKTYYDYKRKKIRQALLNPYSEALQISQALFDKMNEQALADGARFVLVILPSHQDLKQLTNNESYQRSWDQMIDTTCDGMFNCLDLAPVMSQASHRQIDYGYDGSHYGPGANRWIAMNVLDWLKQMYGSFLK